jgi:L-lactate dehydrogenase
MLKDESKPALVLMEFVDIPRSGLRERHDASQYGIGIVSARIAEMVLNDEHAVIPIGSLQTQFGVTLSLPSVVGRRGVIHVLQPAMSEEEREGLEKSAQTLQVALASLASS